MEVSFGTLLEQKQVLSQSQIQSLEILAMDSIELSRMLHDEYLENPVLEYTGNEPGPVKTQELAGDYAGTPFYQHGEDLNEKNEGNIPAQERDTIKPYLLWQLDRSAYTDEEWAAMDYMIDCLEDNGFFETPLEEVALACGITEEQAARCLNDLRQLEPYGIFAEDLKHCLLKQIQVLGMEDTDLWQVVDGYLEAVAGGKISEISRGLGLTTAKVRKCISQIAELNPRPLAGFGTENASYIVPDIILHRENGEWYGELNDSWMEDYKINDYYLKMMKESGDEELVSYFKEKLERVRFLMGSIEQRRQTIMGIVDLIIERQKPFLEGKGPLTPMTMRDAAEALGIHPSTVSRAVRGKYLQYPNGSIFMKSLFTASAGKEDGVSAMGVKQTLKELIEGEDHRKPYSDKDLAELLESRGIHISRRAVAKYREEMGIKGSFERRQ